MDGNFSQIYHIFDIIQFNPTKLNVHNANYGYGFSG